MAQPPAVRTSPAHFTLGSGERHMRWCADYSNRENGHRKLPVSGKNYAPPNNEVNNKMKLIREHVVAARGMLSMSQADLANAAGVSERTIRLFESGETHLKDETLFRIQTALEQRGIIFMNSGKPGVVLDRSKAIIPT